MENMGFVIIFTIFKENFFDGMPYHGISTVFNTVEKFLIKNCKSDHKTHIFHCHRKIFPRYSIPSKNRNLANFLILNPESYYRNVYKLTSYFPGSVMWIVISRAKIPPPHYSNYFIHFPG